MTENSKTDVAAVSTFADHEVILPPNKLKKAVVRVRPGTRDDFDPVARAEAALAELASEFAVWMEHECGRLDAARMTVRARGLDTGTRDPLFHAAHDIKGQAATFGFPLVAPAAESLCRLLEHTPDPARIPLGLIDQHVDAIRAITHRNARGDSEMTAAKLAERLRQVTEEFLVAENRDRPDYLEQILAPSIAPNDAPG
jgi:HPt (histidine-containing phosphotransfer) domain-containing protein